MKQLSMVACHQLLALQALACALGSGFLLQYKIMYNKLIGLSKLPCVCLWLFVLYVLILAHDGVCLIQPTLKMIIHTYFCHVKTDWYRQCMDGNS